MPNLFIVGAPKAGTTSLAKYLEGGGDVFFPEIKEPHFLYIDKVKGNILTAVDSKKEYEELYPKSGYQYYGDASVFGLQFYQSAIDNIKTHYGSDSYILIVLRNPVKRAYSAYLQAKRYNEKETEDFATAFFENQNRTDISPMLDYYKGSLYCDAVKAYLDNFQKVKIVFSDDLFSNTYTSVKGVYEFLGLDGSTLNPKSLTVHNEGGKDLRGGMRTFLMKKFFTQGFRLKLKRLFPRLHSFLKRLVFKHMYQKAQPITKNDYLHYLTYFDEDITCLYELLKDERIDSWRRYK